MSDIDGRNLRRIQMGNCQRCGAIVMAGHTRGMGKSWLAAAPIIVDTTPLSPADDVMAYAKGQFTVEMKKNPHFGEDSASYFEGRANPQVIGRPGSGPILRQHQCFHAGFKPFPEAPAAPQPPAATRAVPGGQQEGFPWPGGLRGDETPPF